MAGAVNIFSSCYVDDIHSLLTFFSSSVAKFDKIGIYYCIKVMPCKHHENSISHAAFVLRYSLQIISSHIIHN